MSADTVSAVAQAAAIDEQVPALTDPSRLLLVDGHSMAYRAFYSHPVENFSTTTGQPTNAVYGFTSMMIKVLTDETPTHIAVAFDVSRTTFRSAIFADYKANRTKTPDDFRGQVSLIKEVLAALRIPAIEVDGYEADDVIATLATEATEVGMQVLICTGDRDALQLVNPLVTVLYPQRGVTGMTRFDPAEVEAKYGLTPAQYPDFAALRGDPSDNLPGIPGVGEKTAAKWIREFGSLEALVDRVDEVKGKVGDALRDHLGSVLQNSQLTQLVRDVPLGERPEDLRWTSWDREQVHQLFDNLQFRVLRDRLFTDLSADEPATAGGFEVVVDEFIPGGLGAWLAEHGHGQHPVGISPYGSWGRGTGDIEAVALSTVAGRGIWVRLGDLTTDDEKSLGQWLSDPTAAKAIHDLKGPLLAAWALGLDLAGISSDTILAAYVAMPGQRSFDLTDLVVRYLKRDLTTAASDSGQLTLDGGQEAAEAERAEQGVRTAMAVSELASSLGDWLDGRGGTRLLTEMELPLARVLARMEQAGIAIDLDQLRALQREFADAVSAAAQDAYAVIGQQINLGSPKQLQTVLFDDLGLPKTKRIKTGYTTDAESLTTLLEQTGHPFLEHLMRHRDVTRLRTVIDGLIPMVDDVGRIHTTFQQTVAATGRLSSTDPNLQNIPIRTAEGRRIRETFVVGAGYESLMTADYSQIEMRIMAHLSEDAGLIEAFASGEDLHSFVASRAFSIPVDVVDPEMRRRIKAMSYGLAYGLSAYGLSQQLRISPEEARAQMEAYFVRFGGVRDYLHDVVDQARMTGYTETIFGRRRYLPDLTSDNRQRREMAERMALNAPIQGSAADIIKVAMLGVDTALSEAGLKSRMLLQVHDELVLEIAADEHDTVQTLVNAQMCSAAELSVPLEVSVGFGASWDAAAH